VAAPRVIVVGAGIVGASIAWHLQKTGARVTILDASEPGGLATRASWAWINASWGNPRHYFRFRHRSMAEWRRLAIEVPRLDVRWCGALCYDLPAVDSRAFERRHGAWGYGLRRVSREEAARIEPGLADPPDDALHAAEEGVVEPLAAAQAILKDAVARGAELAGHRLVTAVLEQRGRVAGVATSAGDMRAETVVLAAGAGVVQLARTMGVAVPLTTPPGLLVHSRPAPPLLNGLIIAPELHMRQTAEGRIVAGSDFGGSDPGADAEKTARLLFEKVRGSLKRGASLELEFHATGYRPTPADGEPVIGWAPAVAGLYLAVMHSGITNAPAAGLFAAGEILSGVRDPLLEPFGPARLRG
jgi:glycine/D-amino acid oxidase-like deaminating enzyme